MNDKTLNDLHEMLIKAQEIDREDIRKDIVNMAWATLELYLCGSWRKLSGEEKLLKKIISL